MSTAQSHQRAFVVEVMGRHCGYLAIVAGLATDADFVFTPELPPPTNWPDVLCDKMSQVRNSGKFFFHFIIRVLSTHVSGLKCMFQKIVIFPDHMHRKIAILKFTMFF